MTPASDDTDRAAREWVRKALKRDYPFLNDEAGGRAIMSAEGQMRIEAFKAGASHERLRPLTSDEADQIGAEIFRAMTAGGFATGPEMADAAYSALQRIRSAKG